MNESCASVELRGSRRGRVALLVAAALVASGCGGAAEPETDQASVSQPYSGSIFLPWSYSPPVNSGGFADAHAICAVSAKSEDEDEDAAADGLLILGRHNGAGTSLNRYRFALYYKPRGWLAWPNIGTATFNSKPACTPLNDVDWLPSSPNWSSQVAIVGKRSSDNQFHVAIMQLYPGEVTELPPPPDYQGQWHSISSSTYASAAFTTVEYGWLVVGGRTSETTPDHSHIYLHLNGLEFANANAVPVYDQANWQTRAVLPALPSGWNAVGDQAVAPMGNGVINIVTRAQNSSNQTRLYITSVFVPYLGLYGWLLDGSASGPPTWTQIATGTIPVKSDPALEYDASRGELTVYFNGGNQNRIFQSTRNPQTGAWPSFSGIGSDTFATAPAATANLLLDWSHAVVARKSDSTEQVWWSGIDPRVFE